MNPSEKSSTNIKSSIDKKLWSVVWTDLSYRVTAHFHSKQSLSSSAHCKLDVCSGLRLLCHCIALESFTTIKLV